jgi:4-alpha-glucanotransferase
MARRAGALVPLFSARTSTSWGIGELPDIVPLAAWLARGGMSQLLLLPLGTIRDGETSPYSATSTMAIDPIYVSMEAVPDFHRAGGIGSLSEAGRSALDAARPSSVVVHDLVRRAKQEALDLAFESFHREEWELLTTRAAAMAAFVARERWWLDDYALFQTLAHVYAGVSWRQWPEPLRTRDAGALDEVRRQFAREVLQHQYWQWIAEEQWQAARAEAAVLGVSMIGDMPFVASMESAEVWARADEFMLDVSAGVPPDAFSDDGQDWGLPTYHWEVIQRTGYTAMRQRARRMAALYDRVRVDHVIGFYRTYGRLAGAREGSFNPADEPAQIAQGEALLRALADDGPGLIAEDLGTVPEFLRPSLTSLGVPGCKVIRWERDWEAERQPFYEPETYSSLSVTMTGTHDTETLASWWEALDQEDRSALVALRLFADRGLADPGQPWNDALRDVLIELAYRSGSDDVILPVQDVFGWRARVNTPGTVGPGNWTWCLPWSVDRADEDAVALERAAFLQELAARTGRVGPADYTREPRRAGLT